MFCAQKRCEALDRDADEESACYFSDTDKPETPTQVEYLEKSRECVHLFVCHAKRLQRLKMLEHSISMCSEDSDSSNEGIPVRQRVDVSFSDGPSPDIPFRHAATLSTLAHGYAFGWFGTTTFSGQFCDVIGRKICAAQSTIATLMSI